MTTGEPSTSGGGGGAAGAAAPAATLPDQGAAAQPASTVPAAAAQAVLTPSAPLPAGTPVIRGWDFNDGADLNGIMAAMLTTGCQATALGQAVNEVNRMLTWRLSDEAASTPGPSEPADRSAVDTKIFLAFTSNLASAGTREAVRWLVEKKMVDVVVTTAGGVEEDLIKCLAPTYLGDFALRGADLRSRGLNRVGNMLVPNANYCAFEDWVMPLLDAMADEQEGEGSAGPVWTPSRVIARLGKAIDDDSSFCCWAARNGIPVYCPAITDGSLGDMLFFHTYKREAGRALRIDVVGDVRAMNDEALKAAPRKTGVIVLGGGLPKHHAFNANLMRNGADFAVVISTAQEFDGSDSGARPDEAVSWGKIRTDASPVKVYCDATIAFPLLLSQTFAKLPDGCRRAPRGE